MKEDITQIQITVGKLQAVLTTISDIAQGKMKGLEQFELEIWV